MTPRAVFDCMVFVQALANDQGPAFACFQVAREGKGDLCVSPAILAEIGDVMARPKLRKRLPSLTSERIAAFLDDVASDASLISDVPDRFRYDRDPKDEPNVNLALAAGARYLTSRDRDLLDLAQDEGWPCSEKSPSPRIIPSDDCSPNSRARPVEPLFDPEVGGPATLGWGMRTPSVG